MVSRIEALIDALAVHNRANVPESSAYQFRNPLLLKSYAIGMRHQIDEEGCRVFNGYASGYKAAIFDVAVKVSGRSRAWGRMTMKEVLHAGTLTNLLGVYGVSSPDAVKQIVKFLRRALRDPEIAANTPLSYFLAESVEYLRKNKTQAARKAARNVQQTSSKDIPC